MKKGIDISEWQGNLTYDNFKSIKDSGIEFIIIRCGYTSYGKSKKKYKDKYFENNYNLAKQLNIPIGTYYYSCATTLEEAREEANFILELVKDKVFEYPICIDTEDNHDIYNPKYFNESQYSIGKEKLTDIIDIICKTVENGNKYVSIYASTSWFRNNLTLSKLKKFDKWIAQWSSKVTFENEYGMWQYSSRGSVNGISGYVDLNYAYKDYPNIMKSIGLNGYVKENKTDEEDKPIIDTPIEDKKDDIENDKTVDNSEVPPKSDIDDNTQHGDIVKVKRILRVIFNIIKRVFRYLIKLFKR